MGRENEMSKERMEYLRGLAEDYGVDLDVVLMLADMLGPNEDYDGLVNALDDIEYFGWEV